MATAVQFPRQAPEQPPCDLVMKGGITSGVVYPQLIAELAQKYRFKNIGGTSAGAIAAAACAAAELGRRVDPHSRAFDELMQLPDLLKARDPASGHSRLFHLFQPAAGVQRHFKVLVSMLNQEPLAAAGRALLAVVMQFSGFALLGVALAFVLFSPVVLVAAPALGNAQAMGLALAILLLWWLWAAFGLRRLQRVKASPLWAPLAWWGIGLLATGAVLFAVGRVDDGVRLWWAMLAAGITAPLTIGLVLALAGLRFCATLVAGMHGNGYGLCSGRTVGDAARAPAGLTDFLTRYFDDLAGRSAINAAAPRQARPLLFADLWDAPFDGGRYLDMPAAERRVNLEVMTSAVSQQMCFAIPFRDEQRLYYDAQEWAALFPDEVMRWLNQVSDTEAALGAEAALARGESFGPVVFTRSDGSVRTLARLPSNANLPVVVAVRMSLSFPALLSAVPLYAVDYSRVFNQRAGGAAPAQLEATRVWFSDGGIASNMPLHFFDSPLPRHPTFAVNLKAEHPDHPIDRHRPPEQQSGRVYLPEGNVGGRLRYWPSPPDGKPLPGLLAFVASIVDTMQNWRDEILFPYPGYRDRIVQVSQLRDEGGLNLDMPDLNIANLSAAGRGAAVQLIERFYAPPQETSEGWRNHKQVRLRAFLGAVERMAGELQDSMADGHWLQTVDDIAAGDYTQAHKALATRCLEALGELATLLRHEAVSLEERAPRPRASLHIVPRI
ncbi:MAG: patatin-like phospholipase family protein [Burkholderiaceae bacterium]